MDDVLQQNAQLENVAHDITSFFGKVEYNTTRNMLLGDMCNFLSDIIQDTIVAMGTKACHVRGFKKYIMIKAFRILYPIYCKFARD